MKSFSSSFTFILCMFLLAISKGYGFSLESLKANAQGKSIFFSIDEKKSTQIHVELRDMVGILLLSDDFNSKDITIKKYNLKNLPDGKYDLQIGDEDEIITKRLTIENDIVHIVSHHELKKPHFFYKNKICTLSFLAFGKKTIILVVDESGHELHRETITGQNTISRKFNFTKAYIEEFKIKVLVDGQVFDKRINIFI